MTMEQVIRDALTCAFLEGGDCAWTGREMGLTLETVNTATNDYVAAALPKDSGE